MSARYGTPLLYEPRRKLVDAVDEQIAILVANEPVAPRDDPALMRLDFAMRCERGHLALLIRRYRRRAACGERVLERPVALPRLRRLIVDALIDYREARLALIRALPGGRGRQSDVRCQKGGGHRMSGHTPGPWSVRTTDYG